MQVCAAKGETGKNGWNSKTWKVLGTRATQTFVAAFVASVVTYLTVGQNYAQGFK